MNAVENASLEARVCTMSRIAACLADRVPYAMLILDRTGTVLVANARFEDLVGRSREEFTGKDLAAAGLCAADLFRPRDVGDATDEGPRSGRAVLATPEGEREITVQVTPLRWAADRGYAFSLVLTEGAEETSPVTYRLSDACCAVSRYASRVAHDMRNPITGVSTGVQYLARLIEHDARHREALDLVLSEIKRLDEEISRLTAIERPEEPARSDFSLAEALGDILSAIGSAIRKRRLALSVHVDPFLPSVLGDREQITRAILAVAERAAAIAREESSLSVRATLRTLSRWGDGGGGEASVVEFSCRTHLTDPRETLEAFCPSSPGWESQAALYLASQIIERHRGSIEISGSPGRRITFSVVLPKDGA